MLAALVIGARLLDDPTGVPLTEAVAVEPGQTCLEHARVAEHATRWLERSTIDARHRIEVRAAASAIEVTILDDGVPIVARNLAPTPADCADLHAAVGLAIALGIDASVEQALTPTPPPEPPPEPDPPTQPPPSPPEPIPATTRAVAPATAAAGRHRVTLGAELAIMSTIAAPGRAGFGGAALGQLRAASWLDVELGAAGHVGLPIAIDRGALVPAWIVARTGVCPRRGIGRRVALRGCLGVDVGGLLTRGRSLAEVRLAHSPWLVGRAGVDVDVRLHPVVALRLGIDGLVPLLRTAWVVRDEVGGVVARRDAATLGGAASIGVVLGRDPDVRVPARRSRPPRSGCSRETR